MARRERKVSVYEPRPHGRRWRFEVRDGVTGKRSRPSFDSEEEAWRAYRDALEEAAEHQDPTIGELIDLYEKHLEEKGNRKRSVQTTVKRLSLFFCQPSLVLSRLTPKKVQALYDLRREGLSVDSHRNELAEAKTFLRWSVKNGYVVRSPADGIEGIGKRRKGKMQLRPAEAKRFLDKALEMSAKGNNGAFAAAVALVVGVRAQEITRRVVRDVDELTHTLTIEEAKTEAGNRCIEIPDVLWPHFEARIRGRDPFSPLLKAGTDDGFHCKEWLGKWSKEICRRLGLPLVNAHGLRGTHSTLAQEAGATGHMVARQLGHESERTTLENYTAPGTAERQKRERAMRVLEGGLTTDPVTGPGESSSESFPSEERRVRGAG